MYAGHLAAAMALKARAPQTATWALVMGVGVLDLLFGPFVLLGLERVAITPGVSPGFSLDYIDWSHSLLMSIVWSGLFGALFLKHGRSTAIVVAIAVFSHFVFDALMHPADLALWPGASVHVGFGLWQALPNGWWFVELAVIGALCTYYWRKARASDAFGGRPIGVVVAILIFHALNAPWLAPG